MAGDSSAAAANGNASLKAMQRGQPVRVLMVANRMLHCYHRPGDDKGRLEKMILI